MVSMDDQQARPAPETRPVSILNSKPQAVRKDTEDKKLLSHFNNLGLGTRDHVKSQVGALQGATPGSCGKPHGNLRVKTDGSVESSPQKQSGSGSAVSFTLSDAQKISQHRYSINSKPAKPETASQESLTEEQDSPLGGKNSIVHMPGDFIYFDSNSKPSAASNGANATQGVPGSQTLSMPPRKEVIGPNAGPQVPFTEFFQKQDDKKFHILLGATGSVATIKVPHIIDKLFKIYTREKVSIQLIVTKPAEHFLRGLKISTDVKIWREEDEWSGFRKMGDPVLHHELKRWADVFLIAPLSANTLAKLAYGICDNLLTSVLRDWTPATPVLVAPAMNTFMYINPMTKRHLSILQEDAPYVSVLKPVEKVLICGDIGMGGMREWNDIVEILRRRISEICRARDENDVVLQDEEEEEEEEEDEDDEDEEKEDQEDDDDDEDEDDDEDDEDDDEAIR
ncbi:uncharacterized protein ZBIST_4907 [Zygosaccharomyces bailii]|nr:uncharacterized protein ZBIST_4907 [Zygosaccharomyces bailii]